eukprot:3539644-Rhodomonas_salina.7
MVLGVLVLRAGTMLRASAVLRACMVLCQMESAPKDLGRTWADPLAAPGQLPSSLRPICGPLPAKACAGATACMRLRCTVVHRRGVCCYALATRQRSTDAVYGATPGERMLSQELAGIGAAPPEVEEWRTQVLVLDHTLVLAARPARVSGTDAS